MKHKVKGRKLSRTRNQRRALLKMLAASLILNNKIKTTEARAKELRPAIERVVHIAKQAIQGEKKKQDIIRRLMGQLPKKAVQKLISELSVKYANRTGGCVRIVKQVRRKSDSARMAIIEFV